MQDAVIIVIKNTPYDDGKLYILVVYFVLKRVHRKLVLHTYANEIGQCEKNVNHTYVRYSYKTIPSKNNTFHYSISVIFSYHLSYIVPSSFYVCVCVFGSIVS